MGQLAISLNAHQCIPLRMQAHPLQVHPLASSPSVSACRLLHARTLSVHPLASSPSVSACRLLHTRSHSVHPLASSPSASACRLLHTRTHSVHPLASFLSCTLQSAVPTLRLMSCPPNSMQISFHLMRSAGKLIRSPSVHPSPPNMEPAAHTEPKPKIHHNHHHLHHELGKPDADPSPLGSSDRPSTEIKDSGSSGSSKQHLMLGKPGHKSMAVGGPASMQDVRRSTGMRKSL
eukprot:1143013-Pelagomonas_calceolata.AAC.7